MRSLAEFTKTTLVGGVLIILPLYVSLLLLAKVVSSLLAMVGPITNRVVPAWVEFREALAIVVLVGICFVAGLVVRTGPGLRAKNLLEQTVLERLPGYAVLRGLAGRFAGQGSESPFAPALVEIEEALVPALVIERLPDNSYTVLVPSVPTPMAGSLYILPAERVHLVDVPITFALKVFSKWGTGAGEFVQAMQKRAAPPLAQAATDARGTTDREHGQFHSA